MRFRFFCLWLVLVVMSAHGAEMTISFKDIPLNEQPPGFTNMLFGRGRPGEWKVVMDDVKPLIEPATPNAPVVTRQPVVAQVSRSAVDERFPLLVYEKEEFGDFTLTTKLKMVDGLIEQVAGVVFRVVNETNFYVIRLNAVDHTIRYYKVINGIRTPMVGPVAGIQPNVWYELKIDFKGNQIRTWLDGKEALPMVTDSSFGSGRIGFWTKSDAVSYFSDIQLSYVPRETLAQVLVRQFSKKYDRLKGLKISVLDANGEPRIIASKDPSEVGQPGKEHEKEAIRNGTTFYGPGKETSLVLIPLRDVNGDPVAAVSVLLKPFSGQTQQNAVARATPIVKEMQLKVPSLKELTE